MQSNSFDNSLYITHLQTDLPLDEFPSALKVSSFTVIYGLFLFQLD